MKLKTVGVNSKLLHSNGFRCGGCFVICNREQSSERMYDTRVSKMQQV